jgi:hypothetical protein
MLVLIQYRSQHHWYWEYRKRRCSYYPGGLPDTGIPLHQSSVSRKGGTKAHRRNEGWGPGILEGVTLELNLEPEGGVSPE